MNEELTITKEQARLSVVGNCYPDSLTNSGAGPDLTMDLIDLLDDLGIDLPDIDPGDWDDIDAIIGYDDEGNPILVYPDPDTGEIIEWPIDFPIDPLDWPDIDVTPGLDDDGLPVIEFPDPDTGEIIAWPVVLPEGFDPEDWPDTDITAELDDDGNPIISFDDIDLEVGDLDIDDLSDRYDLDWMLDLDITGLDNLAYLDDDLNLHVDNLPAYISVVFPPNKTEYSQGQVIDITGLYVYAYDSEGNVWRGTGKPGDHYRSGRVPNGELTIDPKIAEYYDSKTLNGNVGANQAFAQEMGYGLNRTYVKGNNNDPSFGAVFLRDNLCLDPILVSTTAAGTNYSMSSGANAIQYRGATYYWSAYGGLFPSSGGHVVWALAQLGGPMSAQAAALQILAMAGAHGSDVPGQMTVTVSWPRPGDGEVLSTSFEITVNQRGGGGR